MISKGWQDSSKGYPDSEAQGKSWGAALLAQEKLCPSDSFTTIYDLFEIYIYGYFYISSFNIVYVS